MENRYPRVKLGEVIEILDKIRKPLSKKQRENIKGKYRYYGANGIVDYINNYLYDGEYLLISEDGEYVVNSKGVSTMHLVQGKFWVNNHAHVVRANSLTTTKYIYYALQNENITHLITGTAQPKLSQNNLKRIEISLPEIKIQEKIVDMLFNLDHKIQLNNEINKALEEMAQAIFKAWFVDFEPFKDGEFEESELGMIPKGWQVKSLKDICKINMGQSPSSETYNSENNGLPFYQGVKDFKERFPLVTMYCSDPKKVAEKGNILLSVRAPVGSLNIAVETCCIGRGVASIKSELYGNSFVYYLLKNIKWDRYESGTVFSSIKKSDIENYKIIAPSINVVKNFNKLIKSIDYKIYNNSMETIELQKIRDTLLPKLISGEIRLDI